MGDLAKVREWVEAGKQIGKQFWLEEDGKKYWLSVGVQKWKGAYKLYLDRIEESHMVVHDLFDTEEITIVGCFDDIQGVLDVKCPIKLDELTPQKGQRIFNPAFD
jgi:hypothetical protein